MYVDGSKIDVRGGEAEDIILPLKDQSASPLTFDNLNAHEYIDFVFDRVTVAPTTYGQVRGTFEVYYEMDDAPVSVTVTGKVDGVDNVQVIPIGSFSENTFTIDKATKRYDVMPTIKLDTRNGYHYDLVEDTGKDTYSARSFTLMGTKYKLYFYVNAVYAPRYCI